MENKQNNPSSRAIHHGRNQYKTNTTTNRIDGEGPNRTNAPVGEEGDNNNNTAITGGEDDAGFLLLLLIDLNALK